MGLVVEWTTESYMYLGNLVPLVPFVTSIQVFFFETFSELPDNTNLNNLLPFHVYSLSSVHYGSTVFFFHNTKGWYNVRKMITGYIRDPTGLHLRINRVGQALKWVNPQTHCEWQTSITCYLNPVPYFVNISNKNFILTRTRSLWITELIAVDDYSSFILEKGIKNYLKFQMQAF